MNVQQIVDRLKQEPGLLIDSLHPSGEIASFTTDSRKALTPEDCFIAIAGETLDGHEFIPEVLKRGALVIAERLPEFAPGIHVRDSRLASALLADFFYGSPSHDMQIVGVTGTSGKTTSTYLFEHIFKIEGRKVGLIGTVETRFQGRKIESTHTTPDPWTLQKLLAQMRDSGCDTVVMEVSSHALKQHRVSGVAFDGVLFTNLTPEHLDYHPTLEDYFESKKLLFTREAERSIRTGKNPIAAIHVGSEAGARLFQEIRGSVRSVAFEVPQDLQLSADGIRGTFSGIPIHSSLLARFNAENVAGAVALTQALGVPAGDIAYGIETLRGVPGRLERVSDPRGRIVLVDYAHKPDALEKVLKTLRDLRTGSTRILTVFGCGGDRDATKRPVMGRIAVTLSDLVILTSDNPRTEDPEAILDQIEAGCKGHGNYLREAQRSKAIEFAIQSARPGDIVLIAGKGHEDYQIIGAEKRHFDDREVARLSLDLPLLSSSYEGQ